MRPGFDTKIELGKALGQYLTENPSLEGTLAEATFARGFMDGIKGMSAHLERVLREKVEAQQTRDQETISANKVS